MVTENRVNRLLHVYGNEVIHYEEAISETYSALINFTKYSRPPASRIHECLRRILADSALISLIFFPVRTKAEFAEERANSLCEKLLVKPESILKNRVLRNHVAHLDERLDSWIVNSEKQTFGRAMLGSRADAYRSGLSNEDILGLFDPDTFVFSFLADDLRVDDLVAEIRIISQTARKILRDLPWVEGKNNVH